MIFENKNSELSIIVDGTIYSIDVLHKCFYWYGGLFNVHMSSNNNSYIIKLEKKSDQNTEVDFTFLVEKIKQDLIDFKLRDIVTKETKSIRELLIAKAFAYYEIDEDPTTEISDPVGFNPQNV